VKNAKKVRRKKNANKELIFGFPVAASVGLEEGGVNRETFTIIRHKHGGALSIRTKNYCRTKELIISGSAEEWKDTVGGSASPPEEIA